MINVDMRHYDYYLYNGKNAYAQPTLTEEVQGTILMAIYTTNQSITDNIKYKSATYIGLTKAPITDAYAVEYEGKKLKVLYIQPKGRYKQIYMAEI